MKVRPKGDEPEAFKFDVGTASAAIGWVSNRGGHAIYVSDKDGDYLVIRRNVQGVAEPSTLRCYDGQWIIKTRYQWTVCTPKEFRERWEAV